VKAYIRNVVWRFCDSQTIYPELKAKGKITVRQPQDVFDHFRFLFDDQVRERFVVFWLNSANTVTGFEIVTEGTINGSLVHPREVFRGAIVATSVAIIAAHNHPSGNPEPSSEDVAITKQLVESGKILGIPLQDHIIFAESQYSSFAERGMI
jgi:DNA repair protein RadC